MSAETGSTSVNIGRLIPFITLVTIIHALSMAVNSFIPLFLIDRFGIDKTLAASMLSNLLCWLLYEPFGRVSLRPPGARAGNHHGLSYCCSCHLSSKCSTSCFCYWLHPTAASRASVCPGFFIMTYSSLDPIGVSFIVCPRGNAAAFEESGDLESDPCDTTAFHLKFKYFPVRVVSDRWLIFIAKKLSSYFRISPLSAKLTYRLSPIMIWSNTLI